MSASRDIDFTRDIIFVGQTGSGKTALMYALMDDPRQAYFREHTTRRVDKIQARPVRSSTGDIIELRMLDTPGSDDHIASMPYYIQPMKKNTTVVITLDPTGDVDTQLEYLKKALSKTAKDDASVQYVLAITKVEPVEGGDVYGKYKMRPSDAAVHAREALKPLGIKIASVVECSGMSVEGVEKLKECLSVAGPLEMKAERPTVSERKAERETVSGREAKQVTARSAAGLSAQHEELAKYVEENIIRVLDAEEKRIKAEFPKIDAFITSEKSRRVTETDAMVVPKKWEAGLSDQAREAVQAIQAIRATCEELRQVVALIRSQKNPLPLSSEADKRGIKKALEKPIKTHLRGLGEHNKVVQNILHTLERLIGSEKASKIGLFFKQPKDRQKVLAQVGRAVDRAPVVRKKS